MMLGNPEALGEYHDLREKTTHALRLRVEGGITRGTGREELSRYKTEI